MDGLATVTSAAKVASLFFFPLCFFIKMFLKSGVGSEK